VGARATYRKNYKRAFGKKPPPGARIGSMNDSDNTAERSVSYIDYIEVYMGGSPEKLARFYR
jgi:hypothetical protein